MKKQTILIVDDNKVNLFLAEKMLAKANLNFISALNGTSALKIVEDNNIDLILLDIAMPKMNGFEVCEILKNDKKTKEIPIIFLTSSVDSKDIVKGFKLGAADYITKPFIEDELILRVKNQLELKLSKDKLKEELEKTKQKEKQLAESQNKLKIITDNAKDAIIQIDNNSKIIFWNNAATKIFGYNERETLGKNIHNILVPIDLRNIANNKFKEFINTGKGNVINKTVEFIALNKFKNNIPIEISISAIKSNNKWTAIGIAKDITERKSSEAILLRSVRKYKNIIKNLNNIYYRVDANGIITMASPSALKILGYSNLQELIGISLKTLYKYPKEREKFLKIIKEKHQVNGFKATLLKKDKSEIIIEASSTALFDINKKFIGVEGIVRDITKQIENENKIIQSERKYRILTETMQDVVVSISTTAKIIYVSQSLIKFGGYYPKNVLGDNIAKFFAKKTELLKAISLIAEVKLTKKAGKFEFLFNAKNNTTFPIELTYSPEIENNKIKAIHVVMRDITDRVAYKNQLEKTVEKRTKELTISANKFKNIFDASNDAIFITDLEGNFIELNNIAKKRINLSENNVLNLKEFHSFKNSKSLLNYFKQIVDVGENITTSFYQNKSKNIVHIELNGKLIKHNNKKAILHISRDITERKELEEQKLNLIIKTEEKERSRFAKDLHDGIGATLSAAKMYLNIAKRTEAGSEKKQELIEQTLSLMNDIGKDVKQIAVNIRPHNLQEIGLINALNNFCEKLNSVGAIKVEFKTNKENIKLNANVEINIFRIINELINNTLKYAQAKNIFISLIENEENLIINYTDNGKGFDFEKTQNSNKKGTGLDNIIHRTNLLKGNININSEKGKGMKAEIKFTHFTG